LLGVVDTEEQILLEHSRKVSSGASDLLELSLRRKHSRSNRHPTKCRERDDPVVFAGLPVMGNLLSREKSSGVKVYLKAHCKRCSMTCHQTVLVAAAHRQDYCEAI